MTEQPTPSRFFVRKGTVQGTWMVWDRNIRRPARLERGWATGLSEERARELAEQLRLAYGGD
jgi:hypothetical protein